MWKSGWGNSTCLCLLACWTYLSGFLQVIRGAGHYVFADQPDDFNQTVLQILNRTEKTDNNNGQGLFSSEHPEGTKPGAGAAVTASLSRTLRPISSV